MYSIILSCNNVDNIYGALKLEETQNSRFRVSISKQKKEVKIKITADDATALKAITLSLVRLLEAAEKIHNGKRNSV